MLSGGLHILATSAHAVPGPGSPPSKFTYLRSTDAGDDFTPQQLADASVEAEQTHAEAHAGNVHAVYDDLDPQPRRLFYRRSIDAGESFGPSERVDQPQGAPGSIEVGDSGEADLVADSGGVHVVWEDDRVLTSDFTIPVAVPAGNVINGVRLRNDVTLSNGTTFNAEGPGGNPDSDADNTVIPGGTVFPAGSVDPRTDSAFFKLNEGRVRRADRVINRDEVFYTTSPEGGGFPVGVNITDSENVHNRDPVVDAEGDNVVVAYEGIDEVEEAETVADDVLFAHSTDGGATWSTVNQNLTNEAGDQDEPGIALEGSEVTVAFRSRPTEDDPRRAGFVHSGNGGASFSAPVILPHTAPATAEHSTPGIFAQGALVNVVSCENDEPDPLLGTPTFKLLMWTSTDGGATFPSQPAVLDSGADGCGKPDIDGVGSDRHVIYERDVFDQSDVFLLQSFDAGTTWTVPRNLSADQYGSKDPTVSVDPTDASSLHVTWSNQTDFLFTLKYGQELPLEDGGSRGFANEDVIRFTGGAYEMVLDGSDVGLRDFRIDGLARLSPSEFLLSFTESGTVPGVGTVDDSDVVRFTATGLGEATAGSFGLWFDGSDVGLTTSSEDVDAIELRNGDLYLSTSGSFSVAGNTLAGKDEDVFACRGVTSGPTTACASMAMTFDGSAVGLGDSGEDLDAFAFDTVDPTPFLNGDGETEVNETQALFSFDDPWAVPTASGGESDLARCVFPGANLTAGEPSFDLPDCGGPSVPIHTLFLAAPHGLEENIMALELDF